MDLRRLSKHPRLLGTEWHALLPQRPGLLAADQSRQHAIHDRTRASGRERRRRHLCRSRRAEEHCAALSCPRHLRRVSVRPKKWGYVELAGIVRWIRWDDMLADTLDLGGGTTGWGLSLSSNIKLGEARRPAPAGHLRRRRRELLQRRARGRRHREQLRQPAAADRRQGAARRGDRRLSRSHLELEVEHRARLVDGARSTTPTRRLPSAFHIGQYASRQRALDARAERDDGRRIPVGLSAKLLGRFHRERLSHSDVVQIQFREKIWRS